MIDAAELRKLCLARAPDLWARADRLAVDAAAWVPLANTASI